MFFACNSERWCYSRLLVRDLRSPQITFRSFHKKETTARSLRSPITWWSVGIVAVIGGALTYYTETTRRKKDKELVDKLKKYEGGIGKALIGGQWELTDFNNQLRSWRDFLGQWIVIYFGFTHCPDICPEELEKLCRIVHKIDNDPALPNLQPLFFTVDPLRDTPEKIKSYCLEYSPKLLGFSGTSDQMANVCRMFRVYYSEGPKDPDSDYIVDHSIVMYLMDPDGEFVEHYTRETSAATMEKKIRNKMTEYNKLKK